MATIENTVVFPKLAFPQCDPDLVTLTLKLYPDVVKMYHHTKNEVSTLTTSKFV